ncbi:MAG: hypothetical protein ABID71_03370 [Chloroflexota bacterium]
MMKNTVKKLVAVGLATVLVLLAACTATPPPAPQPAPVAPAPPAPPTAPTYPMEITDQLGRKVTLAAAPQRIISIAPSNTEIVFALGLADRLVAVTDYCDYPPGGQGKTEHRGLQHAQHRGNRRP